MSPIWLAKQEISIFRFYALKISFDNPLCIRYIVIDIFRFHLIKASDLSEARNNFSSVGLRIASDFFRQWSENDEQINSWTC